MFKIFIDKKENCIRGLQKGKNYNYYIAGEYFEPDITLDEILIFLKNNRKLPKLLGEFNLLIEIDKKIYVLTSEVNVIKWYYYKNNEKIIISNDFWEIVNYIKPTVEDINKDSIYESLMFGKAFNENTFINNIKTFEPGSLSVFDKTTFNFTTKQIYHIVYSPQKIENEKNLYEEIDKAFNNTVNKIREKNNNPKIGITISGGLDSRFPLPYLKQEEVAISYLIGKKNSFFNPLDYENAKKMADIFGFKFKMIDPFITSMKEKIYLDILRNPTTNSNIMKAINFDVSFKKNEMFDVLITGAYGGLIGGRVIDGNLLNSNDLSYDLFFSYMDKNMLLPFFVNKKPSKYKKILDIIQGRKSKNFQGEIFKEFISSDLLFSKEIKQSVLNKFNNFLNKNKKDNFSKIMEYHLSIHSIKGSFESLHGQVKSYSIYSPYIYELSKKWPIDYLKERSIMEKFLYYKYPKLAEINLQHYDLSIKEKIEGNRSKIKLLKNILKYKIQGLSINYTTWAANSEVQILLNNILEDKRHFLFDLFKYEEIEKIIKSPYHLHFKENLLKVKLLIDVIEEKRYENFSEINKKFKLSTKY